MTRSPLDSGHANTIVGSVTLGGQIRAIRERDETTLRGLAHQLGVSPGYLCDIEHDRRAPSWDKIHDLGALLDINPDVLGAMVCKFHADVERWIRANPAVGIVLAAMEEESYSRADVLDVLEYMDPSRSRAARAALEAT